MRSMMKRGTPRRLVLVAALGLVLGLTRQAEADLALDFDATGGNPNVTSLTGVAGWEFTISATTTITALAYYDVNPTGLIDDHTVSLWSTNGPSTSSPLPGLTAVITNASPFFSTSLSGSIGVWRYEHIAPVTLTYDPSPSANNNYVIGGTYYESDSTPPDHDPLFISANAPVTLTGITYDGGVSQTTNLTDRPDYSWGSNIGVFGPDFLTTPEPSSAIAVSFSLAVGCAIYLVRRRGAKRGV